MIIVFVMFNNSTIRVEGRNRTFSPLQLVVDVQRKFDLTEVSCEFNRRRSVGKESIDIVYLSCLFLTKSYHESIDILEEEEEEENSMKILCLIYSNTHPLQSTSNEMSIGRRRRR